MLLYPLFSSDDTTCRALVLYPRVSSSVSRLLKHFTYGLFRIVFCGEYDMASPHEPSYLFFFSFTEFEEKSNTAEEDGRRLARI